MSKRDELNETVTHEEAEKFEIIELAIEDIRVLARAFNLIADIGESQKASQLSLETPSSKIVLN